MRVNPLVGRKSTGERHLGRFLGAKTPRQVLFKRRGHQARPAGIGVMDGTGIMPQPDHGKAFWYAHFKGPHRPGISIIMQGHALDANAAAQIAEDGGAAVGALALDGWQDKARGAPAGGFLDDLQHDLGKLEGGTPAIFGAAVGHDAIVDKIEPEGCGIGLSGASFP